jgi:hypothetical protein
MAKASASGAGRDTGPERSRDFGRRQSSPGDEVTKGKIIYVHHFHGGVIYFASDAGARGAFRLSHDHDKARQAPSDHAIA